jgi:hypothetical protein
MSLLNKLLRKITSKSITDESSLYSPGSWQWLVMKEQYYGGMVTNVKRIKVSDYDPRSSEEVAAGGMTGGDRMFFHGYAPDYTQDLSRHNREDPLVVIEVGILKGSGLAIWSDLFRKATIIGLDIDSTHFDKNLPFLQSRGAFDGGRVPNVLFFDQFSPDTTNLSRVLAGRKIDIVIDDGFHSNETIQKTFDALLPYLSNKFTYFIEDNETVGASMRDMSGCDVYTAGELSVITRG